MNVSAWYLGPDAPDVGVWWWAVEHVGHPAFYLRALMPGDFASGQRPLPRHVRSLEGAEDAAPACGTCGAEVSGPDLEPIERATGLRGFVRGFRELQAPWPSATDPRSCWLCSARNRPAEREVAGPARRVKVCDGCVAAMEGR